MSILLFNHKNGRVNMALKTKTQETLPDEFEVNEVEQVTFDDVIADMEAEHVDPDELENGGQKFYTISGKESQYEPTWEKYGIQDVDVGQTMEGRPESTSSKMKIKPTMH